MRIFYETYIFSLGSPWWVSFLGKFWWRIHSHSQKCDLVQKVFAHSALLGTSAYFSCIHTLFSSDGWWWVSFLGYFFWWIHFYGQKYNRKQKVRVQKALLGTYAHFYMKLTLFSLGSCWWVSFLGNFWWRIYSHSQICDYVQKIRVQKAILGTYAHFFMKLTFFL